LLHVHDIADEVWPGVPGLVVLWRRVLGEKWGMFHETGGRVTEGCVVVTG
jgi:hypothetical protein